MNTQAEALAQEFEQINAAFIRMVEGLSDAQWRARCEEEGRPAGVVAHHVASAYKVLGIIIANSAGGPPRPMDPARIDASNARHAARHANATREEVLELLRANGAAAARTVRGLSDAQLAGPSGVTYEEATPVPLRMVVERMLLAHPRQHLREIQAATAGQ